MAFFDPTVALVFRIILGLLVAISAVLKMPDLEGWLKIIRGYGLLPYRFSKPLAYSQPFIEFVIGVWMLTGYFVALAAFFSIGSLGIATLFLIYAIIKKKNMENCGCYGTTVKIPVSWKKIVENSVWILLAVYVFITALVV